MTNYFNNLAEKALDKIKIMAQEIIEKYDIREKLDNNGAIYYFNGTYGTDFCWEDFHRTGYFCLYYKNDTAFCMITAQKDGHITAITYLKGENEVLDRFEEYVGKEETLCLAALLYIVADKENKWNRNIESLDFSKELTSVNIKKLINEEDGEENFLFDNLRSF